MRIRRIRDRHTVCSSGVTHDELRAVLPPYAAGELAEEPAEVVRAHLATGCPDCLSALFRLPVGRPRNHWEAGLRRERWLAPATAAVLALALAALVAWTIRDLRRREAERHAENVRTSARLIEVETARAAAVARSDALGRTLEGLRAEVAEARAAAGGVAEERARLEAELAAAGARSESLLRSIRRRDAEIDRLLGGAPERTLADLAAMPGFGVARLEPRTSGRARGHLLWHPARAAALLYAFGLPPAGRSYRVELELDDGRVQPGPTFTPGPDGDAVLPIRLPVVAAHLRGVTVVQEPGTPPVLGARLGAPVR